MHPLRYKSYGGRVYYQGVVFVRHTHLPTMEHCLKLLAQVDLHPNLSLERRRETHKDSHYFQVGSLDGIWRLGQCVSPYSVSKQEQWRLLLRWCELRRGRRGSRDGYSEEELAIAQELSTVLNRRGKAPQDVPL